ncbi:MAG: hypothetical protein ACFFFH_12095 [Candidatus Thorarchaeota archaeon]
MEKEKIPQIIVGIFVIFSVFIILVMTLFSDFWLPLLTNPSIPYSTIAYYLLPIMIIFIIVSILIWKNVFPKPLHNTVESRISTRNVKIGLCLGSLSAAGTRILGRSDYCPFTEPHLHSMLEYSAISVLHGDIVKIIGPFPMKSIFQEEMHYISFGFKTMVREDNSKNLENFIKEGGILGIFLLYYPEQLDSSILLKKKLIIDSFYSATNDITNVSDLIPEKLARIEEDIQLISLF